MKARARTILASGILLISAAAQPACADTTADFYRGKTISMAVGGSEGGGYDTMARAVARFLGKHMPGNPSVVVRSMPGAGGLLATNYLYSTAPKDGTVIGLVQNNNPLAALFSSKEVRFDATKFNWLGTPSIEVALILVWRTVPVTSVEDLKTKVTTMGASGADSGQAFLGRLLNATLGTKMKIVHGYKGMNDIFLAMERGEIDGYPGVFYSALTSTRPAWLTDHSALILLQFGPQPLAELPNVPFASDLVTAPDDKLLMQAASARQELGRPLVMPPNVPEDRVAAVRKALADTFADPAFQAEAEKIGLIVNAPRTGQQIQDLISQTFAMPSRVVDRLRQLEDGKD
jgi:tripartite-type tricarboxylate transporter receptor subunit TctC